MGEIPDNRELTKVVWAVVKVIGLFFGFWLLTKLIPVLL